MAFTKTSAMKFKILNGDRRNNATINPMINPKMMATTKIYKVVCKPSIKYGNALIIVSMFLPP